MRQTPGVPERIPGNRCSPLFAVILILCCVCFFAAPARAWVPRKPLLYGIGERPFPALMTVDYPMSRAAAWLEAIGRAEELLPRKADERIRQLGLPLRQARRAIAAIACPLDVVTPEQTAGRDIRVFLKESSADAFERALADPWRLLLEMCILWETDRALGIMRENWPESAANAREKLPFLEGQAALLRQLWQAARLNTSDADAGALRELKAHDDSVALLLIQAMERPDGEENPVQADKAIGLCLEREISGDGALWGMLAACGNYLRARGHERQGQPALAETDLNTALARMRKSGIMPAIEAEATLTRAELRRKRGNVEGMCEDYRAACGLGFCQGLARARREGRCDR